MLEFTFAEDFRPKNYELKDSLKGHTYRFSEFSMERDFVTYAQWMHQGYVAYWWQRNKSESEMTKQLEELQADAHQKLYMGFVDDRPVSYWEQYWLKGDILGTKIQHDEYDQGLHLLIGEQEFLGKSFVSRFIPAFTKMLFEDPRTQRVYGEPDASNDKLLRYTDACCFDRHGTIELPGKTAALVICEREKFFAAYSKEEGVL